MQWVAPYLIRSSYIAHITKHISTFFCFRFGSFSISPSKSVTKVPQSHFPTDHASDCSGTSGHFSYHVKWMTKHSAWNLAHFLFHSFKAIPEWCQNASVIIQLELINRANLQIIAQVVDKRSALVPQLKWLSSWGYDPCILLVFFWLVHTQ